MDSSRVLQRACMLTSAETRVTQPMTKSDVQLLRLISDKQIPRTEDGIGSSSIAVYLHENMALVVTGVDKTSDDDSILFDSIRLVRPWPSYHRQ